MSAPCAIRVDKRLLENLEKIEPNHIRPESVLKGVPHQGFGLFPKAGARQDADADGDLWTRFFAICVRGNP